MILLATSGTYYHLAVVWKDHLYSFEMPILIEMKGLIISQDEDTLNVKEDIKYKDLTSYKTEMRGNI